MTDVYSKCPTFEDDRYLLRFVEEKDADDLLKVYTDKNALSFFNSDNCDGIITKVPIYAVERIQAVQRAGFTRSEHFLVGTNDGYAYNGYWKLRK